MPILREKIQVGHWTTKSKMCIFTMWCPSYCNVQLIRGGISLSLFFSLFFPFSIDFSLILSVSCSDIQTLKNKDIQTYVSMTPVSTKPWRTSPLTNIIPMICSFSFIPEIPWVRNAKNITQDDVRAFFFPFCDFIGLLDLKDLLFNYLGKLSHLRRCGKLNKTPSVDTVESSTLLTAYWNITFFLYYLSIIFRICFLHSSSPCTHWDIKSCKVTCK